MAFSMTYFTERNNRKPMSFFVSKIMMILFCLLETLRTWKSRCFYQSSISNHTTYEIMSINFCRLCNFVHSISFPARFLASLCLVVLFLIFFGFFSLPIFSLVCFGFFCFSIFFLITFLVYFISFTLLIRFHTYFTKTRITIFSTAILVELKKWFNLVAFRTIFRAISYFDWFRHDFFLIKKLCLEPLQSQSLYGSFYYTNINQTMIQVKNQII